MNKLPIGILKSDLKYDKLARYTFDLWLVKGIGWCIPTLFIAKAKRSDRADRYYAVHIDSGKLCRIGNGPHIEELHTVYVAPKRAEALQKFLDLRTQGEVDANVVRDRRSSRRAQGQLNRAAGLTSWMW
jgi:hypothetical protein